MDCSLWCVKNIDFIIEIVENEGGFFIRSGYNLAQTSADSDLRWANSDRDSAEKLPEVWSCIFGVDTETIKGKLFMDNLLDAYNSGVFNTSREHDGLSSDIRFLHARQDQTAVSWAYHKAGFDNIRHCGEYISNASDNLDTPIKMQRPVL